MCQQAARKMDPCVHGGMVKDGSPDTEIGGFAAARWGDGHMCPLHPPGRITKASATVFINKMGAARKLDTILCMVPATPAPGGPPHKWEGKKAVHFKENPDNEEDYEKFLYASAKGEAQNTGDALRAKGEVGVGLFSISKQGETKQGIGGRFKMDKATAKASAEGGVSAYGGGAKGEASATYTSAEGSVYWGPPGDKGKNPYLEAGASGELFSASASGDVLSGYDGKRIGVGAMGSAGAKMAGGDVKGRTSIPLGFGRFGLPDWTIDIKAKGGGSVGSVEAGGGAMAYYDKDEKRLYLLGALKAALGAGFELGIDISIGKKFGAPAPPAPAPDAVKMGCSTVFIGG